VLYVNSTSAELSVSDLTGRALEIHETSGDSSILNIAADTVNVQSVSGEIDITSLDTSKMTMGSVSGTITLTGVTADTVKSGTTSGEQDFEGTFTSLDLSSVSGEIDVVSTVNPADIKCGTTSGGISITLPGNANLTVSYSTVSGDFSSEVPMLTGGGGAAAYTSNSVSGDIRIFKARKTAGRLLPPSDRRKTVGAAFSTKLSSRPAGLAK
jgi:DUF4097 and DUF4098 domain-containing protein YvlB